MASSEADAEAASFGERVEGEETGGGEKPGKPRTGEGRDEAEGGQAETEEEGCRAHEEEEEEARVGSCGWIRQLEEKPKRGPPITREGGREEGEVEGKEQMGEPRQAASASLWISKSIVSMNC